MIHLSGGVLTKYPNGTTDPKARYEEDSKVQQAVKALREWFNEKGEDGIAYTRQLAVIHEDQFFHWITYHAIQYLHEEGFLMRHHRKWGPKKSLDFYYTEQTKYRKRKEDNIFEIVRTLRDNSHSIGGRGEEVVEMTMGRIRGMNFIGKEVKSYKDREWSKTGEDLDFIYEHNGNGIGIEVKNRLSYPDPSTVQSTIKICKYLGLKPVFIARMIPYPRQKELNKHKGFALRFKQLILPNHLKDLDESIDNYMDLPVHTGLTLPGRSKEIFIENFLERIE